ncbi:MAG: hypothetical protein QOH32_2408 [Bradyrhizobium sp.]|jgi:hypothetical protein|nr:hypothetical protein [Bradyrhizobium sp.]
MAHSAGLNDIQIDRVHGGAIRRAIGERLCHALEADQAPTPPRLRALLEQLAAQDAGAEPTRS